MKYLYVLVSTEKDIYYEQTLFSILTLRKFMPDAFITLLTDKATVENLVGWRSGIKEKINELVVIPLIHTLSGKERSRCLKTTMRNVIDGDFLYLDSDTIVMSSLDIPDEFKGEIGAVRDVHSKKVYPSEWDKIKKLNFTPYYNGNFFNGGVLFVKDSEITRAFFKRWNELWVYCTKKGFHYDQAPLVRTDYEFNNLIQELSGEWNCQLMFGINYLSNVKIIHTLAVNSEYLINCVHPMMTHSFYKEMRNVQNLEIYVYENIQSFRKSFLEGTKIISPLCDEMLKTDAFCILQKIYLKIRILFKIINLFSCCIINIQKWFKKYLSRQ